MSCWSWSSWCDRLSDNHRGKMLQQSLKLWALVSLFWKSVVRSRNWLWEWCECNFTCICVRYVLGPLDLSRSLYLRLLQLQEMYLDGNQQGQWYKVMITTYHGHLSNVSLLSSQQWQWTAKHELLLGAIGWGNKNSECNKYSRKQDNEMWCDKSH